VLIVTPQVTSEQGQESRSPKSSPRHVSAVRDKRRRLRILGYVLSKDLPGSLQRSILIIGIITSVCFIVGATACGRGLHAYLTPIEKSLQSLNPAMAEEMNLPHVFAVMRNVMWVVVICSAIVFAMFTMTMGFLLKQIWTKQICVRLRIFDREV
jgi:hypothetical protein